MTRELKPCPFCGGKAETSNNKFERTLLSWVYCTSCGSAGGYRYTEAEAIEAWNTRIDVEQGAVPATEENMREYGWVRERTCKEVLIDKHWRGCSACGYKWEFMYGIGKCKMPVFCPDCGAKVVE